MSITISGRIAHWGIKPLFQGRIDHNMLNLSFKECYNDRGQVREDAGMSQSALAKLLGVSYQQVQKYENGKTNIHIPRLIQICKIFEVPTTRFIPEAVLGKKNVVDCVSTDVERTMLRTFRKFPPSKQKAVVAFIKEMAKSSKG